jgi:hypothetical protein
MNNVKMILYIVAVMFGAVGVFQAQEEKRPVALIWNYDAQQKTLTLHLANMFSRSEGLIQSGTHILSYCDDSFAMKLCQPIRTSRYRDVTLPIPAVYQALTFVDL